MGKSRCVFLAAFALSVITIPTGCRTIRPDVLFRTGFRFTATADGRKNRKEFRHVLSQITANVGGEGAFHVSIGDIDPVIANHADIVREFGDDTVWIPVVGNHDKGGNDMVWIRGLTEQLPFRRNPGPPDCPDTTFSFDCRNTHFAVLDFYHGDRAARFAWLDADLASSRKPVVFVPGHQPMFGERPEDNPPCAGAFRSILKRHGVTAYICGHSHVYTKRRPNGGDVWHIDVGNAGNESHSSKDGQTFLDVTVSRRQVRFDTWRGEDGAFTKTDSWTVDAGRNEFTIRMWSLMLPFGDTKRAERLSFGVRALQCLACAAAKASKRSQTGLPDVPPPGLYVFRAPGGRFRIKSRQNSEMRKPCLRTPYSR